jgi:hypothetical protein
MRLARGRRRLRERFHQIEVELVELRLQVRQLEQEIFAADLSELDSHLRELLPRPADLPSTAHSAHVSEHGTHPITSQD